MHREQRPVLVSEDNEDGTKEVVIGSFDKFSVIVGDEVMPATQDAYGFYSFGSTLPSDTDVRLSR